LENTQLKTLYRISWE